jgi:DeoR/GlpR family transcriptional regulator of sugar metabolism
MLSQERQKQIHDIIRQRKSVSVTDLSAQFQASLSTIRRDLKEMELRGLITRVHGGALLANGDAEKESPVLLRQDVNAEAKRRIGEAAARLVSDGETITLTAGSTVEAMLPFLVERVNLTIVTNVINIAYKLTAYPHITVVVLGGWLRHSEFSLLGHLTRESLKDLYTSKIFHSTYGLEPEYGLTGTYVQEVETDRLLIEASARLIVLADSSKFKQTGTIRLVPTERIHTLITDTDASDEDVQKLEARGVQVIRA